MIQAKATSGIATLAALLSTLGPAQAGQTPHAAIAQPHSDLHGDPLPDGAEMRLGTIRFRHAGPVNCSAFMPDGKALITASNDCTLRMWDIATGREVKRYVGFERAVHQLALSSDGKRLAAAEGLLGQNEAVQIHIWDVATAKAVSTVEGINTRVEGIAWSPDGKTLAVRCRNGIVHLIDAIKGKVLQQFQWHTAQTVGANHFAYGSVCFSPDGKTLASCSGEDYVVVGSVADGAKPLHLRGKEKAFHFVAFTPDGRSLISGGDRFEAKPSTFRTSWPLLNSIAVWDAASSKRLRDFDAGAIPNQALVDPRVLGIMLSLRGDFTAIPSTSAWTLSADGKIIALAHWDNTVHLWDVDTGKLVRQLEGHSNRPSPPYQLTFSQDGKTLAAAGFHFGINYHSICLLDTATGKQLSEPPITHNREISKVAVSPDSKRLATISSDQTLISWDLLTGKTLHVKPDQPPANPRRQRLGFEALTFSNDSRMLAAGNSSGFVSLFDAATGKEKWQRLCDAPRQTPHITGLAFSPFGKRLAVAGDHTGIFCVCETATGRIVSDFDVATKRNNLSSIMTSFGTTFAWSGDGKVVAADSGDGRIRRWRMDTLEELGDVQLHNWKSGFQAAFSLDDDLAATVAIDCPLIIWDLQTGAKRLTIEREAGTPHCLAVSPNGRWVAICGMSNPYYDGLQKPTKTIELLDLGTGKIIHKQLLPPNLGVQSVVFTEDGRKLITGMDDTTVLIWPLPDKLFARPTGQVQDYWAALLDDNARRGRDAIWALVAMPEQTVPLLRNRLQPFTSGDAAKMRQWIADLGSDKFVVRQTADKELEKTGESAMEAIQKALQDNLPLETRRRLERLLSKVESYPEVPSGETLRTLRAILVLERIGSAEAKSVLETISSGAAGARITEEAKGALERLRD
jgi:WD40 repeat protein